MILDDRTPPAERMLLRCKRPPEWFVAAYQPILASRRRDPSASRHPGHQCSCGRRYDNPACVLPYCLEIKRRALRRDLAIARITFWTCVVLICHFVLYWFGGVL